MMLKRRHVLQMLGCVPVWAAMPVHAHDFKAGDLRIDHPYATPSRPGLTTAAVYFRGIRNTGAVADRLLSASTPVAGRVEIHRMQMLPGAQGEVMQMRAMSSLEIPAGGTVALRHGVTDGHHLMLLDLKAPLKDGDRFPVTLSFEKAGTHTVQVWVQTPRRSSAADPQGGHSH